MIDCAIRYAQSVMSARCETQSIPGVLTRRATQQRRVQARSAEQVPSACQWMRPLGGKRRATIGQSCAHLRARIPTGPLLRAPECNVTRRDGGCDALHKAPVREQTHKPRPAVLDAAGVCPFPLHSARDRVRGAIFTPGVADSLFGPAKPHRSRLAGNENRRRRTRARS